MAEESAAGLRGALAPFIVHGRRCSASGSRRARAVPSSREETQMVRQWAMAGGYSPSSRGRISQDIKKAYDSAQGQREY
ncbi:histone-like nucleoid-structuring protein Lsr2 [Arthrobacter sp.]|uniref:Lsr2 family DNA-binding protein n=1 Tax=Arthrobacter sp. TaxID=1667 RepID=UPI0033945037